MTGKHPLPCGSPYFLPTGFVGPVEHVKDVLFAFHGEDLPVFFKKFTQSSPRFREDRHPAGRGGEQLPRRGKSVLPTVAFAKNKGTGLPVIKIHAIGFRKVFEVGQVLGPDRSERIPCPGQGEATVGRDAGGLQQEAFQ